MLSTSQAFYQLKNNLQPLYDDREAAAIAHELVEHITGWSKTERLIHKDILLTTDQQQTYDTASADLMRGRPLQYVVGSAWFMGRQYVVNEHVLIPRPETEELAQWIIDDLKNMPAFRLLDIGTGSGCLPVSLNLAMPNAVVTACDISAGALAVASTNADRLGAQVSFIRLDFLNAAARDALGNYDVLVSNPPYIPLAEQERIHTNVKDHEPNIALFVPDNDALVFYKAIAHFGRQHLSPNGYIYCELDAEHAHECKALFEAEGYRNVQLRQDMNGHWRMLKAQVRQ